MKNVLVIALVILLESLTGCSDPFHDTYRLRDELQPFCRENDAIVLESSRSLPKGRIYFLEKRDGIWCKSQVIDLTPYLKDGSSKWYTLHINEIARVCDSYEKTWLAFNDRWLVVTVRMSSAVNENGTIRDGRGKAIIFKKVDGVWHHYYTLDSKESFVWAKCVALTDYDQLIVSDPCIRIGETKGVVRCFALAGNKPCLVQEISSPENNCLANEIDDPLVTKFGRSFYVDKDSLFVNTDRNDMNDYLFYRFNNGRWEYVCSFLDLVPQYLWNNKRGFYPLAGIGGVFINEKKILFQQTTFGCGGLLFLLNERGCEYAQGLLVARHESKNFCIQKPFIYTLKWRDKRERFALAKPSPDEVFRMVEPDWVIEDADPTTNQLVSNYFRFDYKTNEYKRLGYNSFYEYTSYVPIVDYSISGTTLATSYYFDACYLPNNPMQKAEVWGGVNIYEIDPEKGPVKKFALTTRNLEELKEVPLNTETPEEEKPFDSKILDKYFK